mmetsp:Transcript_21617/g.36891  ORF Transcript_21617/g.36891 Transcript_21617/m.36891 type:complete len:231 (+) Transcript_21617:101-793(+)
MSFIIFISIFITLINFNQAQDAAARFAELAKAKTFTSGQQFALTVWIEATDGLKKKSIFYPQVDQFSRIVVEGSYELFALNRTENAKVWVEIGDASGGTGVYSGYGPGASRVLKRDWLIDGLVVHYWEFLIVTACLPTNNLPCGTILAASFANDNCDTCASNQQCKDNRCASPRSEINRDIIIYLAWQGTGFDEERFDSHRFLPSEYAKYSLGNIGDAVSNVQGEVDSLV